MSCVDDVSIGVQVKCNVLVCGFKRCVVYLLGVVVFALWSVKVFFFLFKQKTAYDMRISDWSSDVCSSDLAKEAASKWQSARTDQRRHAQRFRSWGAMPWCSAKRRKPLSNLRIPRTGPAYLDWPCIETAIFR